MAHNHFKCFNNDVTYRILTNNNIVITILCTNQ